ncbi:MAG: hypothetical protein IKU82_00545 [Clostridia bacterium]|nr:hypothetical protein [Clostridia bacterium]
MLFGIGAIGYGVIEILWRGRTHWSMLMAGGLSFLGLFKISSLMKNSSRLKKAIAGCILITAIEYIFGIIFNVILKRKVWDYSRMPLNLGGQICALYSFFWLVLSFLFMPLADKIQKRLE